MNEPGNSVGTGKYALRTVCPRETLTNYFSICSLPTSNPFDKKLLPQILKIGGKKNGPAVACGQAATAVGPGPVQPQQESRPCLQLSACILRKIHECQQLLYISFNYFRIYLIWPPFLAPNLQEVGRLCGPQARPLLPGPRSKQAGERPRTCDKFTWVYRDQPGQAIQA